MAEELADLQERNLYRVRRRVESAPGVRLRLRGRELLSFASNDYLNLAADPRLARAAAQAARRFGCGAGASPLVAGYLPPQRALERDLARWEGTGAALVFSSGFVANLAVISAVAGREDAIFSDELNHASLIDGCRLSRAALHIYRHGDLSHLHELLQREAGSARRRLIVTDSVFSMDGEAAPLRGLGELAQRSNCLLLLDEAHASGVLGAKGRGASEQIEPYLVHDPDRLIKVGTLSKALGAQGGFVCGSRRLIAWLVNRARPYIYSTALASPIAAAARRAVAIVQAEPERRQKVLALAALLREQLRAGGFAVIGQHCQIVPVVIGQAGDAVEVSKRLEEQGLLAPAIRPPTVPAGTARLRLSVTAGHTEEDVHRLVKALCTCRAAPADVPLS
jgi:8-amino-7-oxononanoate synthase